MPAQNPQRAGKSVWRQLDEVGTTSKGPKTFETAVLQRLPSRLPGVTCQKWHADAAEANSLNGAALEATPLSALHPLTVGGTTILMVPLDVSHPVQVFVPDQHALIWRGDFEHAGDEFRKLNYALFSYILPPPLLFILRTDWDGAWLSFPTGRKHASAGSLASNSPLEACTTAACVPTSESTIYPCGGSMPQAMRSG